MGKLKKFQEWNIGIKKDIKCPECQQVMEDYGGGMLRWNVHLSCQNFKCRFYGISRYIDEVDAEDNNDGELKGGKNDRT